MNTMTIAALQTFSFQRETVTYAPGEIESLDPVTVHAANRADANKVMAAYVEMNGGRVVNCDGCCDCPLLDGEDICPDCVSFAKAIVLTDAMKYALTVMVENGGDARFEFEREQGGGDDCVFNDLAVRCGAKGYEITAFGRAAIEAVEAEPDLCGWWCTGDSMCQSCGVGAAE